MRSVWAMRSVSRSNCRLQTAQEPIKTLHFADGSPCYIISTADLLSSLPQFITEHKLFSLYRCSFFPCRFRCLYQSYQFFSIYDTQCIVFDHASVVNCSQKFFTSNPEHWVFAWLLMPWYLHLFLFLSYPVITRS